MAVIHFYMTNGKASSCNHMKLQQDGTPPSAATTGTGWTVGTTTPTKYSLMAGTVRRAAVTFGASALPSATPSNTLGDCWRSESALSGTFAGTTWLFVFRVISAVDAAGQDGRLKVRVWKGVSATGSDAVEITSSALSSSTVTNLSTSPQAASFSWTPGLLTFTNEYLFVQCAWEITGVATSISADVTFRVGLTNYVLTPDFVEAGSWRSHPYHYTGHLFLLSPDTMFAAQVDADTETLGVVSNTAIFQYIYVKSITTGALADLQEGMTILCGTSAGADDKGRARVRGVADVSGTDVIEVWASPNVHDGELDLAEDLYITVLDDYRVWMKPPYAYGGDYYFDGDRGPQYVTYDCLPIANAGPGYAEFIDSGTSLITVSFSAADSFAAARNAVLGGYSADRCTGGTPTASTTTGANVAANAFDDDTGTYWESNGIDAINGEWVTYTFAAGIRPRQIDVTASGTSAPVNIYIKLNFGLGLVSRYSRIGLTAWGTHGTETFYVEAEDDVTAIQIFSNASNGYANLRIEEIAVYEEDRTAGAYCAWDVGDGSITVGGSTDESITATFPAGFRWVKLTVTDTNGNDGFCHVPVFGAEDSTVINNFEVTQQSLAVEGQPMAFRVHEAIDLATYPDNTLVMYWEREVYGGVVGSQSTAGPTGREHMKFIGWIDEEPTVIEADETGTVSAVELRCVDVGGRLQRLPGFPLVVVRVRITTPSTSFEMAYANVDRMIYLLVRWVSTASEVADYLPSGTHDLFASLETNIDGSSLYDMGDGRAQTMTHRLTCNKVGQLQVLPDPQLLDSGDRTAILQETLTANDLTGDIDYTHHRSSRYHWLWGSALAAVDQGTDEYYSYVVYFCVAPGEAPGQGLGSLDQGEQIVNTQAELNIREGHRYALRLNAPQDNFQIQLAHAGDSGFDPAAMTWVKLSIPADIAAQRGLTITEERFLLFRVNIEHDHEAQTKIVRLELEREREGRPAITYTPPA